MLGLAELLQCILCVSAWVCISTGATLYTEALGAGLDAGLRVGGQGCISWKQPRLGDMLFPPGDLQGF